jgi:hypothetical protein
MSPTVTAVAADPNLIFALTGVFIIVSLTSLAVTIRMATSASKKKVN